MTKLCHGKATEEMTSCPKGLLTPESKKSKKVVDILKKR